MVRVLRYLEHVNSGYIVPENVKFLMLPSLGHHIKHCTLSVGPMPLTFTFTRNSKNV